VKKRRQRLRLFVCMKTRTAGRSCCAYQGASSILDELRRKILQRGMSAPTSMSDRVVVLIAARMVLL
jgi:hypothetical protein